MDSRPPAWTARNGRQRPMRVRQALCGPSREEAAGLTCDIRGADGSGRETGSHRGFASGSPVSSWRLCSKAILTRPVPLGGRRSAILGDPGARRCPEATPGSVVSAPSAQRWPGRQGSSLEPSPATLGASGPGGNGDDDARVALPLPRLLALPHRLPHCPCAPLRSPAARSRSRCCWRSRATRRSCGGCARARTSGALVLESSAWTTSSATPSSSSSQGTSARMEEGLVTAGSPALLRAHSRVIGMHRNG